MTNNKWFDPALMILGCLYPLSALYDFHYNFAYDWTVHLYNVAYFGEYFRQHFSFPSVISTQDFIGWALPIFYGFTFYSVTGVISSVLGAALAYRVVVIFMFLIQYVLVRKVAEAFGANRFYSHSFALLMTWTIYPLTNLYNRSASTEFAAVIAMNCGFLSWMLLCFETQRWKNTVLPVAFGLFFTFSAGSHPITALYSTITFFFYWLFTWGTSKEKKYLLKVTISSAAMGAIILSPWIYATTKFRPYLQISAIINHIWFSPQAIDWFWTRVSLFPYDPRPPYDSTPHLDAQMSTAFLLFSVCAASLLWFFKGTKKKKGDWSRSAMTLAIVSVILFVCYFVLSNRESIWALIPPQYHVVQMAYRLVSYLNITIFFLAVSFLPLVSGRLKKSRVMLGMTIFCLLTSAVAVGLKLHRATHVYQWPNFQGLIKREPYSLLQGIPFGIQNMARNSYVTNSLFNHEYAMSFYGKGTHIPVSTVTDEFGKTSEVQETFPKDAWTLTNVQAFPWNQVYVDGVVPDPIDYKEFNNFITVRVKPGPHSFSYQFNPDPVWNGLHTCSYVLFFGWILFVGVRSTNRWRLS